MEVATVTILTNLCMHLIISNLFACCSSPPSKELPGFDIQGVLQPMGDEGLYLPKGMLLCYEITKQ